MGTQKQQNKIDFFKANSSNLSNVSQALESGEVSQNKFTCPSCLQTFTIEHSLSIHMNI